MRKEHLLLVAVGIVILHCIEARCEEDATGMIQISKLPLTTMSVAIRKGGTSIESNGKTFSDIESTIEYIKTVTKDAEISGILLKQESKAYQPDGPDELIRKKLAEFCKQGEIDLYVAVPVGIGSDDWAFKSKFDSQTKQQPQAQPQNKRAKAVRYHIKNLNDPDPDVRETSAEMLRILEAADGIATLLELLNPDRVERSQVRRAASESLRKITKVPEPRDDFAFWTQ